MDLVVVVAAAQVQRRQHPLVPETEGRVGGELLKM